MFKQCVICGNEFDTKGNSKTCSDECRRVLYKATKAQSNKKWLAKNHGRRIEQQREYQREYHRRRRKKLKLSRGTCCICGKSFKPKFYHEHFCSDECRYDSPLWRLYTYFPTTFSKFFGKILGD